MEQYLKKNWPIVVVVIIVLVGIYFAARHGKNDSASSSAASNNQTSEQMNGEQDTAMTNGSENKMATSTPDAMMMADTWQGTLENSDSTAKGNLMLATPGHIIYLKTSRDFSALVGKKVTVSYNGTLASFTLETITAQ